MRTETLTTIYITKKFNVSLLWKYYLQCEHPKCRLQPVFPDIVLASFALICVSPFKTFRAITVYIKFCIVEFLCFILFNVRYNCSISALYLLAAGAAICIMWLQFSWSWPWQFYHFVEVNVSEPPFFRKWRKVRTCSLVTWFGLCYYWHWKAEFFVKDFRDFDFVLRSPAFVA